MCLAIDFAGRKQYNSDMKIRIYGEENYKMSKWSGGNTRELAIYPENAKYLDRDFIWRLSSADSDLEESSFTKLPDYDRILMVLDGEVVLAHGEERTVSLKALEQDTFDGAVKTKCFGSLKKDYNLIFRKGSKGRMELIELKSEAEHVEITNSEAASCGIYVIEGYAVVSVNGQTEMVKADRQLVVEKAAGEDIKLSVMGEGKCIFTEVSFERQNVAVFEPDPENAGNGNNFGIALKLSLGNNRWSNVVRKIKKTGVLYTPALEKKLRMLDKFFVTGIVWAAGVILCITGLAMGISTGTVAAMIVIFTLADIFLISPLIYLAVLPKPLSAHMKKSEDLSAYEQRLLEDQLNYDPHHDSLMYKYRDRSGEEYDGMKDFISRLNK